MVPAMDVEAAGGVLAAAAASAAYESAYVLQALEARAAAASLSLRLELLETLVRRPRWIGGIGLAILGAVLQVVALALAPLTVVQPMLALGLLLLLYLGRHVLHERVGRYEVLAAAAIVVGVIVLALGSAGHSVATPSTLTLALALGPLGVIVLAPFALQALRRPVAGTLLVLAAGAGEAGAALAAKRATDELHLDAWVSLGFWVVIGTTALLLALTAETSALQHLAATRVGPIVLIVQIVVPVLLAPFVAGEHGAPLAIAVGLALVASGGAWLSRSTSGSLEPQRPLDE